MVALKLGVDGQIGGHSGPSSAIQIPVRRLMPSNVPGIVKPDIQTPGETESAEHK